MRTTYVPLMVTSNMYMAQFDVICIIKMKLMEMAMMKRMEAFLFCEAKIFHRKPNNIIGCMTNRFTIRHSERD